MPRSKRYQQALEKLDKDKIYSPEEAIDIIKKTDTTKFDAGVEVHVRLGIDPSRGEQQVRGSVTLPHGTGKTKRIAAFAEGDAAKDAQEAGANLVGGAELIDEIKKSGKCDFDIAVATPDMMKHLSKIAKVLGPRGLMPSPKNETISPNLKKVIEELKGGKIAFKNDNTANLHQLIGNTSFDAEKLVENYNAIMDAIKKAKPAATKGALVKSVYLSSSMGPSIKVTP